jgi:predicted AlkP superfamily phosphohydrolase/phosphomutase
MIKPLNLANDKQTKCVNEFLSMIEDTLGVAKTEINKTEKALIIKTAEEIDEYNEEWIRKWVRKSCFSDMFDQKKSIKINDDRITIFFLNAIA